MASKLCTIGRAAWKYCIINASNAKFIGIQCRSVSNFNICVKRNELFDNEKKRQLADLSRIEKIQVHHKGLEEECTLIMNKNLSTPFNCAMHIHELLMNRSVLALVNGKPWDMHRPLVEDCELQFLHFRDENPHFCNLALWRSCSFILGYILENAFKDEHFVELVSFPYPDVKSGSFVYDFKLSVDSWQPNAVELRTLGRIGGSLMADDARFEMLDVSVGFAEEMFADNQYKLQQIPAIAAKSDNGDTVRVYRVGHHTDLSHGPMISATSQLLRYNVVSVHPIESPDYGRLLRVQGLAVPKQLWVDSWAYSIITDRAKILNTRSPVPTLKGFEPRKLLTEASVSST